MEKLNERFDQSRGAITEETWPEYDERLLVEDEVEIVVQLNGKVRDRIRLPILATAEEIKSAALASPKMAELLAGKTVRKVVVIPKKLVNVVTD